MSRGHATIAGSDLRNARKAAGLSQAQLSKKAGIGRHAVSYWECKQSVDRRSWAVGRIVDVLGLESLPYFRMPNARARGWSVRLQALLQAEEKRTEAKIVEWRQRQQEKKAQRLRVVCGAKTRKGTSCRNMSEAGKRRCKFHGGKSAGARTPEGISRIVEAQKRRWARYHAEMVS